MSTKQVLIWRKDLRSVEGNKVRSGKMAAQLAHASLQAIFNEGEFEHTPTGSEFNVLLSADQSDWAQGIHTKICVSVDSEDQLLSIYNTAKKAGVLCSLILDIGLTEFGGIPTYTSVAVGPGESKDIDAITGKLPLL